jgi:hypothetical protein
MIKILFFIIFFTLRVSAQEIIYSNDFNDDPTGRYTVENLQSDWNNPSWSIGINEGRVSIVDGAESYEGKSLRVLYPQGIAGTGGGAVWPLRFESYDELYCSYWVKFADNLNFVRVGKIPGLAGGEANTGGDKPNGRDGWSARGLWEEEKVVQYVYHPDQPNSYGDFLYLDEGGQRYFNPGTWHHLETRIVMNTPGRRDGIVQSWFDGELALDVRNIRFRDVDTFAIDMLWFSTFFGGSGYTYAPKKDEYICYDDFIISTGYVGPNPGMLPLQITTGALPDAEVGKNYSCNLAATKGILPYTWNVAGGNLPAGISLSADGLLSGQAGNAGGYTFTVQVTDSDDSSVQKEFTINVTEPGQEQTPENKSKVYPNPYNLSGSNPMTFSMNETTGGEIKIYTISGKLVKKLDIPEGASQGTWNITNEAGNGIKSGIYVYIIVDSEGNKKAKKLVISNN